MRIILFLAMVLICQSSLIHAQKLNSDSSSYVIGISPSNLMDASAGCNLSIQLGKRFRDKWAFFIEYSHYISTKRDRFYSLTGQKYGCEIRRYFKIESYSDEIHGENRNYLDRRFLAISFLYKQQKYSTFSYIIDEIRDTSFYSDLNYEKNVFICDLEIGRELPLLDWGNITGAVGISVRYRNMHIPGFNAEEYRIGSVLSGDYRSYNWADHANNGWFISPSLSLKFAFNIDVIMARSRRRK